MQTIKFLKRYYYGPTPAAKEFIIARRAKIDADHIERGQPLVLLNDLGQKTAGKHATLGNPGDIMLY
ncbi:MAG TPA: hypothetical protein VJ836_04665 [Candidatus Saccharimonadales bacterium]|nr:hypothetical protein [Candidatus Saccharimonadales bacterium]